MSRSTFFLPPQGHFVRPRLGLARPALRMAWFGIALSLIGLAVFRLGGISATALFATLGLACLLLLAALTISLSGIARAWFQAARGGSSAFKAGVVAIIGLVPFAFLGTLAAENPLTNRAYTVGLPDPEPGAAENTVSIGELTTAVPARRYSAPPVTVTEAVQTALNEIGWQIEEIAALDSVDGTLDENDPLGIINNSGDIPLPSPRASIDNTETGGRLDLPARDAYLARATASDWLFGLKSDATIQVAAEEGGTTVVDIRSVSETAPYDLGQNRRFIDTFYDQLDLVMAGEENVEG